MSDEIESLIDYDGEVQNALRGVVRSVLKTVEEEGLPGDHHFYIAFRTGSPGVHLPAYLVSRFPEEMTIVLQHEYWGLKVFDDYFEVGLNFNQKPELLTIPFDAVAGFVDPSVQFALQFHGDEGIDGDTIADENLEFTDEEIAAAEAEAASKEKAPAAVEDAPDAPKGGDNVVSLDFSRRK